MNQFKEALVEATHRVITGVSSFLPSLLAFLVTVLAFSIFGLVLGGLCGRVLRALDLDDHLRRRGTPWIAKWAHDSSPTLWVQRGITWSGILLGWLLGLVALGAGMRSPMALNLVASIPKLGTASVIIVAGHLLARFLARAVLISAVNRQIGSASLLAAATRWLITIFVVAMAFDHLRIGNEIVRLAFAILVGGIALTAALAFGLGTKHLVHDSLEKLANASGAHGDREKADSHPEQRHQGRGA